MTGGDFVVEGVEGILELAGEKDAWVLRGELEAEFDARGVAPVGGEELDLATELADEVAALDARGFAHEHFDAIAFGGTNHGEGDAGVAARALEDHRVGAEETALLGVLDNGEGETVFDGAAGIEELGLGVERATGFWKVQRQERRAADEREDGRAGAGQGVVRGFGVAQTGRWGKRPSVGLGARRRACSAPTGSRVFREGRRGSAGQRAGECSFQSGRGCHL